MMHVRFVLLLMWPDEQSFRAIALRDLLFDVGFAFAEALLDFNQIVCTLATLLERCSCTKRYGCRDRVTG